MTRTVANRWFDALKAGNGEQALACLDDNIVWINNPGEKGLSDIVPWLGEYHGKPAVIGTFLIWGNLSAVQQFELREMVVRGDEVFAVVHEVATIKATGLNYDIEFIQRFRVANDRIIWWKSYWDTVKGIIPFRGDMRKRLIAAAETGDVATAMLLLPFGANPNTVDPANAQSVLMIAAARGHTDMVKKLIEYGADVNAIDRRAGVAAIHKACQGGNLDAVRALVEAGAFVNQQTATTGHTPLIEAIWFKSDAIVRYLLDHGARVHNVNTYYGFSIDDHMDYALRVNQGRAGHDALLRIQTMVADRKQEIARQQASQRLNNAVLKDDLAGVRAALDAGENIEQTWPATGSFADGHTPLLIASRDSRANIVRELLRRGANVNAVEPVFGAVPLHKATYHGNVPITKMLADVKGVNLDYQGPSNGYTPLHDALWHGSPECAQVLVDHGARVDLVAYDGKRPIDIAIQELGPQHSIVETLRKRMGAGA
jgi:ankyrin repeat protein/ketosteroid isomerase-like protein